MKNYGRNFKKESEALDAPKQAGFLPLLPPSK
jgi:hypothetical protein